MLTIIWTCIQSNQALEHSGLDKRPSLVVVHVSMDGIRQLTYIEVVSNLFTSMTFLICHHGNQYDLRPDPFLSIIRLGPISVRLALTHCLKVDDTQQAAEFKHRESIATLQLNGRVAFPRAGSGTTPQLATFLFYHVAFGSISRTSVV